MKGLYQCYGRNNGLYCQPEVEVLEVGSNLTLMAMEVLLVIVPTCAKMLTVDSSSGLASMGAGNGCNGKLNRAYNGKAITSTKLVIMQMMARLMGGDHSNQGLMGSTTANEGAK